MRLVSTLFGAAVAVGAPNPIRRVVTLMQEMQNEIETEVEKEQKLFAKFECFCKHNDGALDAKQAELAALIKKTKAEVESATGRKGQLKAEIAKHKKDEAEATKQLEEATKSRTEEKQKYDESIGEQKKTLDDIAKAITALEKGMGKSFLQTGAAQYLRELVEKSPSVMNALDVEDQQTVVSFLENKTEGSSAEIVGMLKMMKDQMNETLGGAVEEEEKAVANYEKIKGTLTQLIKSSGMAIRTKTEEKGEVALKVVEGKNVITNSQKEMGAAAASVAELRESCKTKTNDFHQRQKDAADEVEAINQAIAVLNTDDAVDVMQGSTAGARASQAQAAKMQGALLQMPNKAGAASALVALTKSENKAVAMLAFSAKQALKAGKVDFGKILKMIDDMVQVLKDEGKADAQERDFCNESLNDAEADKTETQHSIKGSQSKIDQLGEVIAEQVKIIEEKSRAIDEAKNSMVIASAQRKQENADFIVAVDLNKQAVELILKAKDKLNAYYNPNLVRQEKVVTTREEDIAAGASTQFIQLNAPALKEEPEFASGERKNKSQKGGSVMALMDMILKDLRGDTQAMEHDEQTAQSDYEKLSSDLAMTQADAAASRTEAQEVKASSEEAKQTAESELSMYEDEFATVRQAIADLHARCDFLLEKFEERAAARTSEIEGLQKAKVILGGM